LTRCRVSQAGLRALRSPVYRGREGEYLGPGRIFIGVGPDRKHRYRTDENTVQVRWDGRKSIVSYHRDYIEIIGEKKSEPEDPDPDWDESLWS
jgi:hypothetical protein